MHPALITALVALAYAVTGRLGLLLAIPPGYASAIFPPSGIALAALLVFGPRLWPAVWIGSVGLNLWLSAGALDAVSTLVALGIGCGATLQAIVAVTLVRHALNGPLTLSRESEVLRFLGLGGPVACIVNAVVGPLVLLAAGKITVATAGSNVFSWWIGDTLGVVVVAPFVLLWTASPKELWRRRRVTVGTPLALTFALTTGFFVFASGTQQDAIKMQFDREASHVSASVRETLDAYLNSLIAVERTVALSERLDRETFRAVTEPWLTRYPGVYGFSWTPRVESAPLRFPVTLIEPLSRGSVILGYDVGSDPHRLPALVEARDTGKPATATGIRLRQDPEGLPSILVTVPVYAGGTVPVTLEERRTLHRGFVNAVFRVQDMLAPAARGPAREEVAMRLVDDALADDARVLFDAKTRHAALDERGPLRDLTKVETVVLAGRPLRLELAPGKTFEPSGNRLSAWAFMVCGLLFSALLGAFLLVVTGRGAMIEGLVEARTREIRKVETDLRVLNKTLEDRVSERTATLQEIADSVPNMVWVIAADGEPVFFNKRWQEYTGLATVQDAGSRRSEILHPDDAEASAAGWKRSLATGEPYVMEYRLRNVKGEFRWHLARTLAVRDQHGAILRWVGTATDIDDQKQAEIASATSEAKFRQLTESIPQLVYIAAADGAPLYFNSRWQEFTGLSSGEIFGGFNERVVCEEDRDRASSAWGDAIRTGRSSEFEMRLKRHDGQLRWFAARTFPLRNTAGQIVQWAGMLTDIQDQKLRSELEVRERAALESARLKSEFLATMSHEIRTPVNGVTGMTSLLLDTTLDATQREYALGIKTSSEMLLTVINDILDFSKVEAGKVEFENVPFPLKQVLDDVQLAASYAAAQKGLPLFCTFIEDEPTVFQGDPARIKQVLSNLVSNAVKFTNRGHVALEVDLKPATNGFTEIRFKVDDSGIGIAPAAREKLFLPFTQADSSTTRQFGGTGLGLSICKGLVERMGGSIGVDSRPGRGSTFWFTLRLPRLSVERMKEPMPEPSFPEMTALRGRALVVDDVAINQVVTVRMLEKLGLSAVVASNGKEAVEAVAKGAFDLVFMDCSMPEMDGYEATRRIRDGGIDVVIVAMTANAMKGDEERCRQAGMDDYISKPFPVGALTAIVRKWLGRSEDRRRSVA